MNTNVGPGGERRSIDDILETARARLQRVTPEQLDSERAAGALIVDIRPIEQRQRDGECPGAVTIDRNVLEWRLDPTSAHHITDVTNHDLRIVIVCNEGYGSSLAAAFLQDLGLHRATDLAGGFQAWLAIGSQRSATAPTNEAADPSTTTGPVGKTRPAPRSRRPVADQRRRCPRRRSVRLSLRTEPIRSLRHRQQPPRQPSPPPRQRIGGAHRTSP